jgi:hypothetical protein
MYIANPGYMGIADVFFEQADSKLINLSREDPKAFNDKMDDAMKYEVAWRWFFNDGMWTFGVDTPSDLVKALYDALACPKEYTLFTTGSAASLHCQNGTLSVGSARMFDWREEHL